MFVGPDLVMRDDSAPAQVPERSHAMGLLVEAGNSGTRDPKRKSIRDREQCSRVSRETGRETTGLIHSHAYNPNPAVFCLGSAADRVQSLVMPSSPGPAMNKQMPQLIRMKKWMRKSTINFFRAQPGRSGAPGFVPIGHQMIADVCLWGLKAISRDTYFVTCRSRQILSNNLKGNVYKEEEGVRGRDGDGHPL